MREKLFRKWAQLIHKHPLIILIIVLLTTVFFGYLSSKMKMDTNMSNLLPDSDPRVVEYNKVVQKFTNTAATVLVLQGDEKSIKEYAKKIVPKIENLTQYVKRVKYTQEKEFIAKHGFMLTKEEDLQNTVDMFQNVNLLPLITAINDNFEKEYVGKEESIGTREKQDNTVRFLDQITSWISSMDYYTSGTLIDPKRKYQAVDDFLFGEQFFISDHKNMLLIFVEPSFSIMEITPLLESTEEIQKLLDEMETKYPNVIAGLTGFIPLQKDEMDYSKSDMNKSSIIALVLILLLFIISFRMFSTPILAVINLIFSIIIANGVGYLLIGNLNMMTAMFAVILIGLGIDFSIHIITIYNQQRSQTNDSQEAMTNAFLNSGMGIITGALTTSSAFFTLMISRTKGISEMGLMLGCGIIIAMIVTLTFLPAILILRERVLEKLKIKNVKPKNIRFEFLEKLGNLLDKKPNTFLIIGSLITVFLFYRASNISFDYNMMNMEPKGIPSVVLQDSILEAFEMGTDFVMLSVESIEKSYEVSQKAKVMKTVGSVDDISTYLPPMHLQKKRQKHLIELQERIKKNSLEKAIDMEKLLSELERLEANIYEIGQMAFLGGTDKVDDKCNSLIGIDNSILLLVNKLSGNRDNSQKGLLKFQTDYFPILKKGLYNLANPAYIEFKDLPTQILSSYQSEDKTSYLLTIKPNKMIWEKKFLVYFTKQMEKIDERITGLPVIFLTLMDYILEDGAKAMFLSIFVVFLLLLLDFRSLRLALITMVPLLIGSVWMVGLLHLFGIKFNFINVMGLPMIIGIGIDDGVHIVHGFKKKGFVNSAHVLRSTGKAVLLTSLTTIFGFGSMMIAKYQGLASLGLVLAIGVWAFFCTSVFLLPPLLIKYGKIASTEQIS